MSLPVPGPMSLVPFVSVEAMMRIVPEQGVGRTLTALRTAATSAVVAKYLAPEGAKVMAMIGNGAQSEFQCLAFKAICGIDTVRLYDIDGKATEKAERNLRGRGLKVVACNSAEQAIEGAQIITTCTADKQHATILTDDPRDLFGMIERFGKAVEA